MIEASVTLVEWSFCKLDGTFCRDSFDCEVPALNDYLKKYANQYQKQHFATTYVAIENSEQDQDKKKVVGYYSLSCGEIEYGSIPSHLNKTPKHSAPIIKIGRLAVTKTMQGKGLGKELLFHAIGKTLEISERIGIFALAVDAIDEKAKKFYVKYSFIELQDKPLTLILPLKTIEKLFS